MSRYVSNEPCRVNAPRVSALLLLAGIGALTLAGCGCRYGFEEPSSSACPLDEWDEPVTGPDHPPVDSVPRP